MNVARAEGRSGHQQLIHDRDGVGAAPAHEGLELRAQILERLAGQLRLEEEAGMIAADVRRLNALLCVIGGADFLAGTALPPEDLALAQREGWIWVRGS